MIRFLTVGFFLECRSLPPDYAAQCQILCRVLAWQGYGLNSQPWKWSKTNAGPKAEESRLKLSDSRLLSLGACGGSRSWQPLGPLNLHFQRLIVQRPASVLDPVVV